MARALALTVVVLVTYSSGARAQAVITVNDEVNFRLGVLGQFQSEWLKAGDADEATQNLFIRRVRLLFGGQVAKNVTFFIETDAPNLGKTSPAGTNISPPVIVQDAYGEFKFHDAFAIDAGLMFVPFSRNSLQSAGTLLPIDYGAYTFSTSGPTRSTIGRDTGFQAKGYFLENRLEYRLGAFQGARDDDAIRSFRYLGRVQYQLLEPEATGFFYTGSYFGTKRVVAIGAAFDTQDQYRAYDADVFIDHPFGHGAISAQAAWHHIDGDRTFVALPRQHVVLLEAGYFLPELEITPVVQFTNRAIAGTDSGDESRWSIGANYWWRRHNANVKAAYSRVEPRGGLSQNGFTIQLQLFYY